MSFRVEKQVLDHFEFLAEYSNHSIEISATDSTETNGVEVHETSRVGETLSFLKENDLNEFEIVIIKDTWYLDYKNTENKILCILKFGKDYIKVLIAF